MREKLTPHGQIALIQPKFEIVKTKKLLKFVEAKLQQIDLVTLRIFLIF